MYGNYIRNLDDKRRVVIPTKLKKELGGTFYITLGTDNVLECRDEKSFAVWRDKLTSVNMLNKEARLFARLLLGRTIEVKPDKANRVSLPETFLNRSGITKEIVFVGVGNKVEIWPKAGYDAMQKEFENEGSIDELAKKLLKDGVEL